MDHSHTKREKSFSKAGDVAICSAWLCITQDPVVSNWQPQAVFWRQIIENYVQHNHHCLLKVVDGHEVHEKVGRRGR